MWFLVCEKSYFCREIQNDLDPCAGRKKRALSSGPRSKKVCSVPFCNKRCIIGETSLHKFPEDRKLASRWIHLFRMDVRRVTKNSLACSSHFLPKDFINDVEKKRRILRKEAQPSQCLPSKSPQEISEKAIERQERYEARCRKKLSFSDVSTSQSNISTSYSDVSTSHSDLSTSHSDPSTSHSDLSTSHSDLSTSHSDPSTSHSDVSTSHSDPSTSHSDLSTSHSNPPPSSSLQEEEEDENMLITQMADCSLDDINIEPTNIDTIMEQNQKLKQENEILKKKCEEAEKINQRHRWDKLILQSELERLKLQRESPPMCFTFNWNQIKGNEAAVRHFTGLPTAEMFEILYSNFSDVQLQYFSGWKVEKIDRKDQLLITLMKLKLNTTNFEFTVWFSCSEQTIRNIWLTWVHVLHRFLFITCMQTVPSRSKNKRLPVCFGPFPNCRMIIDCTEIFMEVPKDLEAQRVTYSNYKHRNTMKALVGIAPSGVVTFASKLFGGRTSDKEIVQQSGVLNVFEAGDLILADKGFLIEDILPRGVTCNIPPFLSTPQFSPNEVALTRSIAKARVHVERAIERIKRFKILHLIEASGNRKHADVIFQTCAALTNLDHPLIRETPEFI